MTKPDLPQDHWTCKIESVPRDGTPIQAYIPGHGADNIIAWQWGLLDSDNADRIVDRIALWLADQLEPALKAIAVKLIEDHEAVVKMVLANPPRHQYWPVGDPDCPSDIKAPNGELHTLRCRVCGLDEPRNRICLGPA